MGFRYASHVRKQLSNGINYTLDASGIWGLLFSRRMVPVEVARVMVKDPHHSEETTSNSSWSGTVGQELVVRHHPMPV